MDGRRNNKGTVGNKGGRKPKAEELQLLETIIKAGEKAIGATPMDELWVRIWDQAYEGSKDHQQMILQYAYGKPKQIIEMDNTELTFKVVKADD